jgi:UDPglucose--hexose-1-phosphate uridylyltransferase
MPELRQNIATKEWVIIATERATRPEELVQPLRPTTEDRPEWEEGCPFCPGNEESVPATRNSTWK